MLRMSMDRKTHLESSTAAPASDEASDSNMDWMTRSPVAAIVSNVWFGAGLISVWMDIAWNGGVT